MRPSSERCGLRLKPHPPIVHERTLRVSINSDRNDISTETSPGPEEHDNLGTEDSKGTPPTDQEEKDDGDVLAEDSADQ